MKQILHILISFFLLANIAFTQIGVGYLHHHESKSGKSEGHRIHEAEEDACIGCSLHIIQELFYLENFNCAFTSSRVPDYSFERIKSASYISFPPQGRAPPAIIG